MLFSFKQSIYLTGMKIRLPAVEPQMDAAEAPKSPTETTHATDETKKRPRLDFSAATGGRERKRGKSIFGILVGTLNKAKIEDKERNASDAVGLALILNAINAC